MTAVPRAVSKQVTPPKQPYGTPNSCLVLLYSYPDTVHRVKLHKTLGSTSLISIGPLNTRSRDRHVSSAIADCRYRAPLTPHLAQLYYFILIFKYLQLIQLNYYVKLWERIADSGKAKDFVTKFSAKKTSSSIKKFCYRGKNDSFSCCFLIEKNIFEYVLSNR